MSILHYNELVELVEAGVIENVHQDQINGASIDLTLGSDFMVEDESLWVVDDLSAKKNIRMKKVSGPLRLTPGQFVLASTEQVFNLPRDISALYVLKSSMARNGLQHLNAGFAGPGWHGSVLTLEFKNVTQAHTLLLRPGMKCGQMLFWRGSEVPEGFDYAARGQYCNDKSVQASKVMR